MASTGPSKGAPIRRTTGPDTVNLSSNLTANPKVDQAFSADSMHSSVDERPNQRPSPARSAYDARGNTQLGDSQNPNRVLELQNYVVNKIELMKRTQANVRKATQLAAFIPDYILNEDSSRKIPYQTSTDAIVLMADVSGFTALTEAYSLKGKGGTDQLTKTLMNYIGPIAECILLAEGDIVKYAGDAFLAFWRTNSDDYAEDVQRVIDCALYIQEKYGSYLCKEVDITIKVKIGIGAGIIHLSWIGSENYQHYLCFGPGVEGASAAEKHCVSGEIILHPSTWQFCGPSNYKISMRDETFRLVTEILNFVNPEKRGRPMGNNRRRSATDKRGSLAYTEAQVIRPQLADSIQTKTEEFMRRFIIPPVLRKLDDEIPLEYLNESRVICICFIHVETVPMSHEGVAYRETMNQIVNKGFVKIYLTVTKMQGALTKVILFDKGLTYLVVFGLPGFINENQCAHALKFSHKIRRNLLGIRLVDEVSIGVTTGSCYCGVLGHPKRQEYTVIGRKVNKAARLMCYYPGRVTCDQDTAYHSKLPSANFDVQEYRELKGIANPGKIYEFINAETSENQTVAYFPYPILGREAEMQYFQNVLLKARKEFSDHIKISNMSPKPNGVPFAAGLLGKEAAIAKGIWMIVFEGENGIGKSRMLSACMQEADRQNVRQFSVAMNLILSGQSLFGLSCLVMEATGMNDLRTTQEREDHLRKRVTDPELALELCVLNDIVHTKFPLNPKYTALDVNASHVYGQHVLSTLLRVLYPDELILFVIDDAHLLDTLSWEYISYLSRTPNVFTIGCLRRNTAGSPKISESISRMLYHNKNVKIVRLNGLDTKHCLALACQIMEVKAIPQDVEKILVAKSQGVPAWCDQVLTELVRVGVLKLLPFAESTKKTPMLTVEKQWIVKLKNLNKRKTQNLWAHHEDPDDSFGIEDNLKSCESLATLSRKPSMGNFGSMANFGQTDEAVLDPNQRMIVVKSDTNILHVPISGTLHEILLDSYDELNSTEQIILKCATVLGRKFSRQMLTRLLPLFAINAKKYESGFNHLLEARYIRCASGSATKPKPKEQATGTVANPDCYCKQDAFDVFMNEEYEISNNKEKLSGKMTTRPRYWNCKFMEFVKESLIEVVYDLMTEDQRKDFHLKAAKYLDSSIVRCESCGGSSTAYMFGIILKTGELGVLDNEEALRAAANARRKSSSPKGVPDLDEISPHNGKRKTSLTTKMEGLKKTFHNNGSKVGQIELDILQELRQFETKTKRKWCCNDSESKKRYEVEVRKEMHELRNSEDDKVVNLKTSGDEPNGDNELPQTNATQVDGSGEHGKSSFNTVDLRLCECAGLQAKLCIEMVKHYREAQKYGKCLVNLLDAAESVITIGNGTQALIHLEDALGLMKAISLGDFPSPDKDDQDDARIDRVEADGQIEYLSGLAYFEIGVYTKARDYFIKALARLGLVINSEENRITKGASIIRAKSKLWRSHNFDCCSPRALENTNFLQNSEETWNKKIRILSYLHIIFKQEKKLEMALLVTLWEVITAEEYGEIMQDVIPSYCNMMEMYSALSQHTDAERYEKLALAIIREAFGSNEQIEPIGLLTTANMFFTISTIRLKRGAISGSIDSAYISLRIAQTIHDNTLIIRILPSLVGALLMSLRLSEGIEALQKLWYTAEEEDDWCAIAMYYSMSLDLLLNTAYPIEHFSVCENFVMNSDWTSETNMFHDYELQFGMEASLALWYSRYSRWEKATKWITDAESHRPKLSTFLSVSAELKLLECHLIYVNHYLDCKRYERFAKARNAAKELMRILTKSTKTVPVLKPRFLHLLAYYYRIRSRNVEAEKQLKAAEKLASEYGNQLEKEWIVHSRTVWGEMAIPTVKYFWLEHTESHTLDWHSSGKIPWANIMYSLPLPAWK